MGFLLTVLLALTKIIDPNGGLTSGTTTTVNASKGIDPNGGFTSNTTTVYATTVIDPNGGK